MANLLGEAACEVQDCIYLDHQATTPLDPRVAEAMGPYLSSDFGNPSSAHLLGRRAAAAVEEAREAVRCMVGAGPQDEIIFMSGATEANNHAILGSIIDEPATCRVVTSVIEHPSVLRAVDQAGRLGAQVVRVGVDASGVVDVSELENACTRAAGHDLLSIMWANNEVGSIQPMEAVGRIGHAIEAIVHTDATQAAGLLGPIMRHGYVDMLSLSSHKIYGPKGAGALVVRAGVRRPLPLLHGGGQERGVRPGTLNVPAIVGFGAAARILSAEYSSVASWLYFLREALWERLRLSIPHIARNACKSSQLPGCLSVTLDGVEGQDIVQRLLGVAISTGSACSAGKADPSHVLLAMGLDRSAARRTVRLSVGRCTSLEDIDVAAARIALAVGELRAAEL